MADKYISGLQAAKLLGYNSLGVIKGMVKRKELRNFAPTVKNGHRQKYKLRRTQVEGWARHVESTRAMNPPPPEPTPVPVSAEVQHILDLIDAQFGVLRASLKKVWG